MAKIQQNMQKTRGKQKKNTPKNTPLDTSAQLSPPFRKPPVYVASQSLQKRAKAKFISDKITLGLLDLQRTKDRKKPFWNTYHCSKYLFQEGQKLTSHYCNNRWCLVCNRIRSAKLITGYSKPLSTLDEPYFVTLTIPNVPAEKLKKEIDRMQYVFNLIRKSMHKRGTKIIGIRKLEVTYNQHRNDYHPHFHLIVSGKQVAEEIINGWLKRYTKAERQAQDFRKADMNSIIELFKYFTKMVTKHGVNLKALDVMIKALKGRRVVQPMGINKYVSEDVDEIMSMIYSELESNNDIWEFVDSDWYSQKTGEKLTGFVPSETLLKLRDKIF